MAKLGKHKISVRSSVDYNEQIGVEVEINVSKNGDFYFTLNDEQQKMLLDYGIDMSGTINKRTGKPGTFYATSLAELKKNFEAILEEAVSGEILEDRNVILYQIKTFCSYCMSEGIPVPNGYYVKDEELKDGCANWHEGTERAEGESWGFRVYAQVYHKQVIKFKSGKVKTFYWVINYDDSKKLGEYGMRLNHFGLKAFDILDAYKEGNKWGAFSMNGKREIDYTEQNAKFFHDILIAICKMNEQIKDFIKDPDKLQFVINSQIKLLQ